MMISTRLLSVKLAKLVGCQDEAADPVRPACSPDSLITSTNKTLDSTAPRSRKRQYIPRITPYLQVCLPNVTPSTIRRMTTDKQTCLENVAHFNIGDLCNIPAVLYKSIYGQTPYSQETKSHKPSFFQSHTNVTDNILVKRDDVEVMSLGIMRYVDTMSITTGDTEQVFHNHYQTINIKN